MSSRLALFALLAAAVPASAQPTHLPPTRDGFLPPVAHACCADDDDYGRGLIGLWRELTRDRATAGRRIKAVRALADADCHRWPEAETALIAALRCDRNECVRYEAALALSKGCCCTPAVTLALSHVVSCSDRDGAPWETSGRVRAASANALERCLASRCCARELPPLLPYSPPPPSQQPATLPDGLPTASLFAPSEYYARARWVPPTVIADSGRWCLDLGRQIGYSSQSPPPADVASAYTGGWSQAFAKKPTTVADVLTGPTPPKGYVPTNRDHRLAEAPVRQVAYVEAVQPPVANAPGSPGWRPVSGVPAEPIAIGRSSLNAAPPANPYRFR